MRRLISSRTEFSTLVFGFMLMNLRRRIVFVIASLTVLSVAVGITIFSRGSNELAAYKAALKASGENLSLSELAPPFSKEALDYHRQLEELAAQLALSPIHPGMIQVMDRTNGGFAKVSWEQPVPVRGRNGGTWEEFGKQMKGEENALAQIREMLDHAPPGSVYDRSSPPGAPFELDIIGRRKIAQALSGATINHLHQGQLNHASTNLQALISLSRQHDGGGLLIDRMIQVAITGMAISATWEALQAPGWDEKLLARLQEDWQRVELLHGFAGTAERERAFSLTIYEMARTNTTASARQAPNLGAAVEDAIHTPVWRSLWAEEDEMFFLRANQLLLAGLRQAETNSSYLPASAGLTSALKAVERRRSIFDRFRFNAVRMMLPNWQRAFASLFRMEATRQLAIAAIAIRRYQLRHQQLPDSLERLVPDFLPTVPRDVMNGQFVQYQINGTNRFRIYSVGTNGIPEDAGGDDISWPEPIRRDVGAGSPLVE